MARWSSGLRLRPLTPATAVRIRYGSPLVFHAVAWCWHCICSVQYSSLAQSVEHAAVNRRVVGSSPTGGATSEQSSLCSDFFIFLISKQATRPLAPPFLPRGAFLSVISLRSAKYLRPTFGRLSYEGMMSYLDFFPGFW